MMGRWGRGLVEGWRRAGMDPTEEEEPYGEVPYLADKGEEV